MRKTANVRDIITSANEALAGWSKTAEERMGVIRMVEVVLHGADAYDGFTYLTEADMETTKPCQEYYSKRHGVDIDVRPGVRSALPRYVNEADMWFDDTDETRRHYFINRKL